MKQTRLDSMRNQMVSPQSKLIGELSRISDDLEYGGNRKVAKSLVEHYRSNGFLTDKQWLYVENLLLPKKKDKKPRWIYVADYGAQIRIGVCVSKPKLPSLVEIRYYRLVGSKNKAKSIERKMHRYCKEHHIKGEWFKSETIPKIDKFFLTIEKKHKLPPMNNNLV